MENINDFDSVRDEQQAIQNSTQSERTHTHTQDFSHLSQPNNQAANENTAPDETAINNGINSASEGVETSPYLPPTLDKPLQLAPTTNLAAGSTGKNNQNLAGLGNNNIANNTPPTSSFWRWQRIVSNQDDKLRLFDAGEGKYVKAEINGLDITYSYIETNEVEADRILSKSNWIVFVPTDGIVSLSDDFITKGEQALLQLLCDFQSDILEWGYLPELELQADHILRTSPNEDRAFILSIIPEGANPDEWWKIASSLYYKMVLEMGVTVAKEAMIMLTEDIKIIITGTDWNGQECSRLLHLALFLMPWGKIFKGFKAFGAWILKTAKPYVDNIVNGIASRARQWADEVENFFGRFFDGMIPAPQVSTSEGLFDINFFRPHLNKAETPNLRPNKMNIETDPINKGGLSGGGKTPTDKSKDITNEQTNLIPSQYTTKIKWGIHEIEARPFQDKGYWGKRIPQKNSRVEAFEQKINPNNESFYIESPSNGGFVQFENLVDNKLQDGKLILQTDNSIYHIYDKPEFLSKNIEKEALRQAEAANSKGLSVEWLVSDRKAEEQLRRFFQEKNINITVKFFAE